MAATPANLLRHVHQLLATHAIEQLSDRQLLERFHAEREEATFALLVRRHGPMVLGVCRRVLGHEQDAEDAFQAAFLILARRAGSIRQADVGGYLYRVAHHVALRARARAANRVGAACRAALTSPARLAGPTADALTDASQREVCRVVEEELARLPEALRSAVVLHHLEGKTHEEAARLLGWSKGTLRRRLDKGRELLRHRLAARGLAPAAALTVPLFADATVSAALAGVAVRTAMGTAAAPTAIAALAEGAIGGMGKTKAAAAIVLLMSVLSGVGLWACSGLALPNPPKTPALSPTDTAKKAEKDSLILRGRVLGPDDKPIAGAKLYLAGAAITERGTTGADGRFNLELPRREVKLDRPMPFIASADGFGLAWIELGPKEAKSDLTLRLVKDVPIRGRLLTTEGKPIAGVTVSVFTLFAAERMDEFLRVLQREGKHADEGTGTCKLFVPLNEVLHVRPSDKDGRFEIRGVGVERLVGLEVKSAGLAPSSVMVLTRTGFDSKAFRKDMLPRGGGRQPPQLFGPSFEHVVERVVKTNRLIIDGVVRQSGGKPVAGATVSTAGITSVSDANGRYRLEIARNNLWGPQYWLYVTAPANLPLIGRQMLVNLAANPQSQRVDVELMRGVVVTGRVYDKATGKGVPKCTVYFYPLPENKTTKTEGLSLYSPAENDGRFRLVALPGPGVLLAQAGRQFKLDGVPIGIYKMAEFDAADRKRIKMTDQLTDHPAFLTANGSVTLDLFNACKVVDIKEGERGRVSAPSVTCDLALDPGKTKTVHVQDAEGKPLTGALAAGISADALRGVPLKTDSCNFYALDPDKPRPIILFHAERKLAAVVKLRGDEKEPLTIRLKPTGIIIGRAVEADGQPVAGAEVYLGYDTPAGKALTRSSIRSRFPKTDKDGRFRLEGVVPGFTILGPRFIKGRQVWEPQTRRKDIKTPVSGKTLDLGDIRTKTRRP